MSAYPADTADVLTWRGYSIGPDAGVDAVVGVGPDGAAAIVSWAHADPQPTPDAVAAWAADPAYRQWRDRRADPASRARDAALAQIGSPDPIPLAVRAACQVLFESLAEVRAHLGLPTRTWPEALAEVARRIGGGAA